MFGVEDGLVATLKKIKFVRVIEEEPLKLGEPGREVLLHGETH